MFPITVLFLLPFFKRKIHLLHYILDFSSKCFFYCSTCLICCLGKRKKNMKMNTWYLSLHTHTYRRKYRPRTMTIYGYLGSCEAYGTAPPNPRLQLIWCWEQSTTCPIYRKEHTDSHGFWEGFILLLMCSEKHSILCSFLFLSEPDTKWTRWHG